MLIDGFVDRLMLTGKPELSLLWWKVLFASSFENAVSPCVLRNCLNCGGVVERSWTWRRKARFTYITSSGCQLPFTFFGRQSCCFELGNLAMPRKQYWTKKILANALRCLRAQFHVLVLSSEEKYISTLCSRSVQNFHLDDLPFAY